MQCPSNCNKTFVPPERRTQRNIVCFCRSWIFLRLMLTKHRLRNGKQTTMSRADHWTHVRSMLLVKRKYSTCGTWRFHRNRFKGTNRTQPCWPQVDRYQRSKCRSSTLPFASGVYGGAPQRGRPIFSATPPLETLRVLLCVACQEDVFQVEDPFLISIADVSRAHFCADAVRDVYVRLPDEDPKPKQPGVCGKLRKTMYGSLGAAQRWREHNDQVFGDWRIFPRRGISVPFFPQRLGDVPGCFIELVLFHWSVW